MTDTRPRRIFRKAGARCRRSLRPRRHRHTRAGFGSSRRDRRARGLARSGTLRHRHARCGLGRRGDRRITLRLRLRWRRRCRHARGRVLACRVATHRRSDGRGRFGLATGRQPRRERRVIVGRRRILRVRIGRQRTRARRLLHRIEKIGIDSLVAVVLRHRGLARPCGALGPRAVHHESRVYPGRRGREVATIAHAQIGRTRPQIPVLGRFTPALLATGARPRTSRP